MEAKKQVIPKAPQVRTPPAPQNPFCCLLVGGAGLVQKERALFSPFPVFPASLAPSGKQTLGPLSVIKTSLSQETVGHAAIQESRLET